MKKAMKVTAVITGLVAIGMFVGCGDDSSQSTGLVAKGLVSGAKVKYKTSAGTFTSYSARSASLTAVIPYNGLEVASTEGKYTDMNGTTRNAPDLATPAGFKNVTPLTTLYNSATATEKTALQTLLGTLSMDTVVTGTITSSNLIVSRLNEVVGEVLTQFKDRGYTVSLSALATAVAASSSADLTSTTSATLTTLATTLVSAAGSSLTTDQKRIIITQTVAIANKTIVSATVPTSAPATTATATSSTSISGSTGGASTGTGVNQ